MNPAPAVDEPLLLDYVFGLLDPADVARVEGYLGSDPAWQAAHAELLQFESLVNVATRGQFSQVQFVAPEQSLKPSPLVEVQASPPDPDAGAAYRVWLNYVVAVSFFWMICGLAVPILHDLVGFTLARPSVVRLTESVDQLKQEQQACNQRLLEANNQARMRIQEQMAQTDRLFHEWLAASQQEQQRLAAAPFTVAVKGPASAEPGRTNEYSLLLDRKPSPDPVPDLTAIIKTSTGEVLYETKLPQGEANERKFTVPAVIWSRVGASTGLTLEVLAQDPRSQELTPVRAPVNLYEPIFTTFLTTDKPLYRPGESIYFRTLTLERSRLLPPETDQTLKFELLGPDGKPVAGVPPILGLSRLVREEQSGRFQPVLGPDGEPVRGVAGGIFALPGNLPGGQYKLLVTEALPNGFVLPNARPIAVRKLMVAGYNPDRFLKTLDFDASSYGPGDQVRAKIVVSDQVRSVTSATLDFKLDVDDDSLTLPSLTTDSQGQANLVLSLPKKPDLQRATLTVRVTSGGIVETLVRPIPIRTAQLKLEFFPEGGELIEGVPNRVYFRATTALGQPADLKGQVTDGLTTVATLQTLTDAEHRGVNQGLGMFEFTPLPGRKYAVMLSRPEGVVQPILEPLNLAATAILSPAAVPGTNGDRLPPAIASGVALQVPGVVEADQPIRVQLFNQGAKRQLVVGAYVRGRPVVHEKRTLAAGESQELALDLGTSPLGGVTRITVFEQLADQDDLKPIAERLVYRRTAQALQLTLNGFKTDEPYTPGEKVQLTVQATNEARQPVGAILWAAVVNQSVLSQANDRTERSLPTHFLLNGEVDTGDDLEDADFLLTDHPKAAQSLDLLLGTQGWRRFVAPAANPAPAADPFLALSTNRSLRPSSRTRIQTRPALRTVLDDYWPQYEASATVLDEMEQKYASGETTREESQALNLVTIQHDTALTQLRSAAQTLAFYQLSLESRLFWLPINIVAISVLLLAWLAIRNPAPVRSRFHRLGGFVLLGTGLLVLVTTFLPALVDNRWKKLVPEVLRNFDEDRYSRFRSVGATAVTGAMPPPTMAMEQQLDGPGVGMGRPRTPGPDRLPAQAVPFALGDLQAEPDQGHELPPDQIPFAPRGRNLARPQVPPAAPLSPAAARLQQKLQNYSEAEQAAFLGVPRTPPLVVRSFAYARNAALPSNTRTDFAETLYWEPLLIVPAGSTGSIQFELSDSLNSYRVLVAGHSLDGRLGSTQGLFEVRKPFAIEPKLPLEISSADKLNIPLMLLNNSGTTGDATLRLGLSGLETKSPLERSAKLPLDSSRVLVELVPTMQQGTATLGITARTERGHTDQITRTMTVVPDGFPVEGNSTELLEGRARVQATLPPWIPGTLSARITVYPNTLAQLQGSLEGLLREPHGCFEQSSSSNYPNVLVLEYLREQGRANTELAANSREFLRQGYSKLTSYECPKTGSPTRIGFEWFGAADRQHETLTAYGLLQFTDMARVYPVEEDMLRRTKQFLLDSRDGQGGFRQQSAHLDSFGRAPKWIADAYIVWALTEAEKVAPRSDLSRELDALQKLCQDKTTANDPYFLALVANALHNVGQTEQALPLFQKLGKLQAANGSLPGAQTSITRSTGRDLLIETTALTVLGWLKSNRFELFGTKIPEAMAWLLTQRGPSGTFGGTQATILALKALVAYGRINKNLSESAEITVSIADKTFDKFGFKSDSLTPLVIDIPNPETVFRPGDNTIQVVTNSVQAYPMSVTWSSRTLLPRSSPEGALTLNAVLDQDTVSEGDPVRLTVTLKNQKPQGQGMAVAVIGLPAGLKLPEDRAELKQLSAVPQDGGEPTISHWETNGRELVLYWRGLQANQTVTVPITLIAEWPGEYRGPASRAYLYYGSEHKHWIKPLSIKIAPK